jgi:hypothetical protein
MSGSGNLHLVPPLYDPSGASDYIKSGQALALAWSPRDNSFLAYSSLAVSFTIYCIWLVIDHGLQPNNAPGPSKPKPGNEEPNLYVVGVDSAPAYARRSVSLQTTMGYCILNSVSVSHRHSRHLRCVPCAYGRSTYTNQGVRKSILVKCTTAHEI